MSEVSYGYVVDAFQIAYALGLLAAGRFVDKVGTRIGYMVVMTVWSLSAMSHALANSVLTFGIARFSLGIGESGNFPAAIKTVAEWFPRSEQSLAVGIFNSGATVGAVLAPLLVPWVAFHMGWHAAFLITGCFSLLWIVWWYLNYREPTAYRKLGNAELRYISEGSTKETELSIPWRALFGYRQTWAFALGKFLTDPIWWFYLFWLPSYFSVRFHLSLMHLGLPLILVYGGSAVGSIGGGWLPAPFRKLGLSQGNARLAAMFCCACLVVPIFLVNYVESEWAAIALLGLAAGAHCGWSANILTMPSDMFPYCAVGSVTGMGGMAGSVGGMVLATSTGFILQLTHSYASLFVVAASSYLLSFLVIVLLAPGLRRVELVS
jgi:ACS family hexuronate transporter-like MFS transporter